MQQLAMRAQHLQQLTVTQSMREENHIHARRARTPCTPRTRNAADLGPRVLFFGSRNMTSVGDSTQRLANASVPGGGPLRSYLPEPGVTAVQRRMSVEEFWRRFPDCGRLGPGCWTNTRKSIKTKCCNEEKSACLFDPVKHGSIKEVKVSGSRGRGLYECVVCYHAKTEARGIQLCQSNACLATRERYVFPATWEAWPPWTQVRSQDGQSGFASPSVASAPGGGLVAEGGQSVVASAVAGDGALPIDQEGCVSSLIQMVSESVSELREELRANGALPIDQEGSCSGLVGMVSELRAHLRALKQEVSDINAELAQLAEALKQEVSDSNAELAQLADRHKERHTWLNRVWNKGCKHRQQPGAADS